MKINWIIMLLVISSCSVSKLNKKQSNIIKVPIDTNKHYYSIHQNHGESINFHDSFTIEIRNPIIVTKEFDYSEIANTEYLEETDSSYLVQVKPKHIKYVRFSSWDKNLDVKNEIQILDIYSIEFPAIHEQIYKDQIDLNSYKFRIEVLEEPAIIYREFKTDSGSKFKSGYWTNFMATNMTYTNSGVAWSIINRIEFKLKELGYSINTNGILEKAEIEELKKFQAKNGIASETLNTETLIKLEIQN